MTLAKAVGLGINLSVVLMVFAMALRARKGDLVAAFARPALLLRSLLAMYVIMPALAVTLALHLQLDRALLVALMLIAVAPVPPVLPAKQLKAGADGSYVLGLLVVSSLAAIVVVPAGVEAIGWAFRREFELPLSVTARVVGTSVLLPVLAGLATARLAPSLAAHVAQPLSTVASVLLVVLLVPVLASDWDAVRAHLGNFTIVAIVLFIAAGLLVGHLLGGPGADDRTALALATATRHPGVAIAVMHAVAPAEEGVVPVIVLYLLAGIVASIPYVRWRQRVSAGSSRPPGMRG